MSWEPRPLPDVTPETERFWKATADGELLLGECEECDLVYYYPRTRCPDCLSESISWRSAAGTGKVYTYSSAEQVAGWPEDELPLVVAYVELTEGPRVMTNLVNCDPADVEVGMSVELEFLETEEDLAIPVFTPQA